MQTHPIARKAALFNDDLPPVLRGTVEAREQVMQVTRQCRRVRHFLFFRADQLRQGGGERGVDMFPGAIVRVGEMARDGAERVSEVRKVL
jgi:hypothetical protein